MEKYLKRHAKFLSENKNKVFLIEGNQIVDLEFDFEIMLKADSYLDYVINRYNDEVTYFKKYTFVEKIIDKNGNLLLLVNN